MYIIFHYKNKRNLWVIEEKNVEINHREAKQN